MSSQTSTAYRIMDECFALNDKWKRSNASKRDTASSSDFQGVYIIAPHAEGPCKIGISHDVAARIHGLQTACWLPLNVHYFAYFFPPVLRGSLAAAKAFGGLSRAASLVECEVHGALRETEAELCGEWFDIPVSSAIMIVEAAAKELRFDKLTPLDAIEVAAVKLRDDAKEGRSAAKRMRRIIENHINSLARDGKAM